MPISMQKRFPLPPGRIRSPESLQIILRTEGTKETEEDSVPAMSEDFQAEGNIFQRLWSILVRIAEAVAGVFRRSGEMYRSP